MSAKRLSPISLCVLFSLLLAACAPAAAPTAISTAPRHTSAPEPQVVQTQVVEAPPAQAPWPTQAPAPVYAATATPGMAWPGTVPTPSTNQFQDYGVNPYVDTRADHLSTFAIDVDTAAYSVARRYLSQGSLPPAEAVRVEEFVNYFEQDYPLPEGAAFGLYADGAPSPFTFDGTYLLRFGVQGYRLAAGERKPASLTFVVDISGSMSMENRLDLVKRALELLVEQLRPTDTVALVVYGSEARVVLFPTSGEDRFAILSAIYSLQPEGATNAEAGLRLGYDLAQRAWRPEGINRVVLCSDGVANVGQTRPDAILESVGEWARQGIQLTTIGVGMGNFNDVLLEQLADRGDGSYAYVDDLDEARKVFVDDLTSTLQVIAYDAKIQVDFNPDVVAYYRLLGYENRAVADQAFRNDAVDAGEVGAGHSVTALYAVRLQPGAQGRLATLQLRWQEAETRQVREINGNFNTWDLAAAFDQTAPRYQLAVVVAQYAEILRRSPWAAETRLTDLRPYVYRLTETLGSDPAVTEFASLLNQAIRIAEW